MSEPVNSVDQGTGERRQVSEQRGGINGIISLLPNLILRIRNQHSGSSVAGASTKYDDYLEFVHQDLPGLVDQKTDRDLELGRVFEHINQTRTLPGQSVLYAWLKSQCTTEKDLLERVRWIRAWDGFKGIGLVRSVLERCGHQIRGSIVQELWNPVPVPRLCFRLLLILWLVVTLFAYASPLIFSKALFVYISLPVAMINVFVHFRWHGTIAPHYDSICYLARLIKYGARLAKVLPARLEREGNELAALCERARKIKGHAFLFLDSSRVITDLQNSIIEYFRVFLLAELFSFIFVYKYVGRYSAELKRIFELIGRADASLSVHEFTNQNAWVCTPEIMEDDRSLRFSNLVHPLIPECVGNSAAFDRGVILTGSNMAGKSSFLRTLGINQVLATTLGFAFATTFRTSIRRVTTSIQTIDDLMLNQSHYYAEASRLFALWHLGRDEGDKWLILVDEVLSGTNSSERNQAVIAILADLTGSQVMAVVTTHELDIARSLQNSYENYHFSEEVGADCLCFDYKLKPGIVLRSNALEVLRLVGFPRHLIP